MRNEKDLDVPNVHEHTLDARRRTNGNSGRLQAVSHTAEALDSHSDSLIEKIKRLIPHTEVLEVAGRAVKGFVVPHWAAGVLLAAMLGSMGFMYSRLSDQRDMLIRLDTQLQERDKHELEYRQEFKNKQNLQQLQIENMTKNVDVLRAMLTPQQIRALERRKEN